MVLRDSGVGFGIWGLGSLLDLNRSLKLFPDPPVALVNVQGVSFTMPFANAGCRNHCCNCFGAPGFESEGSSFEVSGRYNSSRT